MLAADYRGERFFLRGGEARPAGSNGVLAGTT